MNPRYVLAVAAMLLLVVSELAGEGGPIASLAQPPASATAAKPVLAAAPRARPTQDTSDFFANYEPPEDESSWPVTAGARTTGLAAASTARVAPPSAVAASLGALPLDRLGVELPSPSGVAPEFVPG